MSVTEGSVEHQRPWVDNYPPGVDYNAEIDLTPVHERVAAICRTHADRVALDFLGAQMTYRELGRRIDAFCGALQQDLGVRKGTHIAMLLPNSPFYAVAYFAALKAGATIVNCNPLYTVSELSPILENAGADLIITADLAPLFEKAEAFVDKGLIDKIVVCRFTSALPWLKGLAFRLFRSRDLASPARSRFADRVVGFDRLLAARRAPTQVEIDPARDVAVQQYTGGTTGLPKGAMLSHANIAANLSQVTTYSLGLFDYPSKLVAVLPFFHIFAMTACLNAPLANGGQVVIMPRWDLKGFLEIIDRKRPNVFLAVPTLLHIIATSSLTRGHDLSCLETCVVGGAALPGEIRAAFAKVSDCLLAEGYGLTECSPVVCCAGLRSPSKPLSIGMPLPGTDIRFVDLDDPTKEMPLGERGELVIKGPQVMLGYYANEEATEQGFADGWFRTGDVGYVDTDGYVYLVDRIKDIIVVNGFNVYPRTIEDALLKHPAVHECNVIGVEDAKRGEMPVAFVTLVEGEQVTEEDLRKFLKTDLSPIAMPRRIEFRDELPKTFIGKLSKKELRQELKQA